MSLSPDHPWYWIEKNRQRKMRASTIGAIAQAAMIGPREKAERAARLQRAVGQIVDDEFAAHCTLGPMTGGQLRILVKDESLVQPLRLRWLFPLLQNLPSLLGGLWIGNIRFSPGVGGMPIQACPREQRAKSPRARRSQSTPAKGAPTSP